MTACPHCYSSNPDGAAICRGCNTPLQMAAPVCPNGHQMSETWTECAYCRAEGRLAVADGRGYRPTSHEGGGVSQSMGSNGGRETKWEDPMPQPYVPAYDPGAESHGINARKEAASGGAPPQRRTIYTPAENVNASPSGNAGKSGAEKIVGVLITYSRKPEGQLFPVREGRNRIGRDASQCDISMPEDETMSSVHCSITLRKKFVISDLDSKSGTYVNGDPIEEQFFPLENYAELRTGSTVWTFVMLDAKGSLPVKPEQA